MALPNRTSNPLCHVLVGGTANVDMWIVPLNSEAKAVLDAHFSAFGGHTTIAMTQEDAGRGGYQQTGESYKATKLDLSA